MNEELEKDFMEAYENNDEITEFIKDLAGEDIEVYTEYHHYSDGKHKVMIDGEPIQVNAWTQRADLYEELKEMFGKKKMKNAMDKKCKFCKTIFEKGDTGNIDFDEIYCSSECYIKGE